MDADDDSWTRDDPHAKNPYRVKNGDPNVIEILMKHGIITQIDSHRHAEIKGRRMSAQRPNEATSYVQISCQHEGKKISRNLHIVLFPEIDAPRDHINRDKLDNRAINIRTGANGINQRNRHLLAGGVYPQDERRRYRVRWVSFDSVQKWKAFRWQDYPTKEACQLAAVAFRKQMADAVEEHILTLQAEAGGAAEIPKGAPPPRVSKAKVVGLTFTEDKHGHRVGLAAEVGINKVRYTQYWNLKQFESEDEAIEEGKRWLAKTKLDHPRQPYKKKQKQVE